MAGSIQGVALTDEMLDACARYQDGDASEAVLSVLGPLIAVAVDSYTRLALDEPGGVRREVSTRRGAARRRARS